MQSDIQSKVLIVKPTICQVGKSKIDKQLSSEVQENHLMAKESGQWTTKLWPPASLAPFTRIVGEAKKLHDHNTVVSQFGDLLPTIRFEEYRLAMNQFISRFDAAADEFAGNYDSILAEARRIHNGQFRQEYYPYADQVRSKFQFTLFTSPLPRSSDVSITYLDDARIAEIRAEIESNVQRAGQQASEQVMARVLECVQRIANKLADPEAIFRDSLIDNLRDVLAIAPALNIASDPAIVSLIQECSQKLVKDPESLRVNAFSRETTAMHARQIAGSFGNMGGRKLAA